jgi:hypothetical protein
MATKKTKKISVESITPKEERKEEHKEEKKGAYKVFIKINGIVTEGATDDIAAFILEKKPALPKTTLTIRVTKGKVMRDRFLQLQEAKRLYSNEITMAMFIKNLLF